MKYFTGQYIALSWFALPALGSTSFVTGRKRAQKYFNIIILLIIVMDFIIMIWTNKHWKKQNWKILFKIIIFYDGYDDTI